MSNSFTIPTQKSTTEKVGRELEAHRAKLARVECDLKEQVAVVRADMVQHLLQFHDI